MPSRVIAIKVEINFIRILTPTRLIPKQYAQIQDLVVYAKFILKILYVKLIFLKIFLI
ncbi:hypothetical protein C5L33_000751 [Lactobacillus pasteurii]|nr:hypothetical protein C5L33_000751 [Lactobacillus pasteurii]